MANVSLARVKVLTAAASLSFFAFAAARAARVPLTYDEAASYIRYIDTSVPSAIDTNALSVFNFEVATNHFVNTVLTKICWLAGGGGEVWLRLPNLIAYALFMVCSILILRRRADPWIALAGFALLNLNPYTVEFFSLSRGYGLGLAFLMGAVLFLLRFVEGGRIADVSRALALALAAVMANFALLDVYISLLAVIVVAGAALPASESGVRPASQRWLPIVAPIFIALVFSQDIRLSDTLYKPVTLTVIDAPLDRVTVVETDAEGRERRWRREAGAARWHSNPGGHLRGLRVEVPAADAPGIGGFELLIGSRLFASGPQLAGWTSHDSGSTRVFVPDASLSLPRSRLRAFRAVVNWAGDGHYAMSVAAATAWALLGLAAAAVLLKIAGRLAVRTDLVRRDLWRTLETGTLWTAALAGVPLYLLRTHGELYFGGHTGLVRDSFLSLINRSFYGRIYLSGQTGFVFAVIVASVLVFCVVFSVNWRRKTAVRLRPAACVLALMAMTPLLEVAQRTILHALYLTDRTALFYVPLYVLFAAFLCEAIAETWSSGRTIVRSVLGAAVLLSALHFAATANTTATLEWPSDASTKAMMTDLRGAAREGTPRPRVVLALDPIYLPSAVYYARRGPAPAVDIAPAPWAGADFFYGAVKHRPAGMEVVREYPATATTLARAPVSR